MTRSSHRPSDKEIHAMALRRMAAQPFGDVDARRWDFPTFVIESEIKAAPTPREELRSMFISSLADAYVSEDFLLRCTRRMLPLTRDGSLEAPLLLVEASARQHHDGLDLILRRLQLETNMHRRINPVVAMWDHATVYAAGQTLDFNIYRCQQMTMSYQLGLYNVIFGFSTVLNLSDEVAAYFQRSMNDIRRNQDELDKSLLSRPRDPSLFW